MCGRYFIDDEMWREIRKICKQIDDAKLKVTVGDVRPTDYSSVPVTDCGMANSTAPM